MPKIAEQTGPVTGGAGTHAGGRVAAVVDRAGRVLGTQAFPADARLRRQLTCKPLDRLEPHA
jgi:hypothetical protein